MIKRVCLNVNGKIVRAKLMEDYGPDIVVRYKLDGKEQEVILPEDYLAGHSVFEEID